MDHLDRTEEKVYAFVPPPGALLQDTGRPARRSFSRKARILLLAITAAVTVGLHVFKYRIYAYDSPEIIVRPASTRTATELTKEFDWQSVSTP